MRYHKEFRINKKGAECFRTANEDIARTKLAELTAKRKGIYTLQVRVCPLDRYGCETTDLTGRASWSPWR